ncbi:MAG: bile acid:sodium symporter family protein [Planctomycetia bacterium]|nr:bile acid:sodium symporter family protein [Planctomycetia bacterium]
MPMLAFCLAKLFHIEGGYFIGMMLAGCVPGAMASNVLTLTARGNVSYSVGLTTSATLLSPLVVPATLWLFLNHAHIKIDTTAIMINLLITVVAPVAVGFTLARMWSLWRRLADAFAEIIANLAIIWIIASVVAKNFGQLSSLTLGIGTALALLNIGGYLAGYFGGKSLGLDSGMRRALAIEVGMQNAGLGTSLAMNYFPNTPEAALICATYTFGCMATGIILAQSFRFYTQAQEKRATAQVDVRQEESASE